MIFFYYGYECSQIYSVSQKFANEPDRCYLEAPAENTSIFAILHNKLKQNLQKQKSNY